MKWLIGLAALVLGCALLVHVLGGSDPAVNDGGPTGNSSSPSAPATAGGTPVSQSPASQPVNMFPRSGERPALQAPDTRPKKTADQQFTAEIRDSHWAAVTEDAIKQRLYLLRDVRVGVPECRDTLCKLSVTGSTSAIEHAISDLESKKHGLGDIAQSWILSAPQPASDGMTLVAYARFSRMHD